MNQFDVIFVVRWPSVQSPFAQPKESGFGKNYQSIAGGAALSTYCHTGVLGHLSELTPRRLLHGRTIVLGTSVSKGEFE
jgi:hypothetical protein